MNRSTIKVNPVPSMPSRVQVLSQHTSTQTLGSWLRRSLWPLAFLLRLLRSREAAAVIAVTVLGGCLRLVDLTTIPLGMQGDEAAAGLEAQRILSNGWIGPYSGVTAGSPTGFFYLVALSFQVLEHDLFAIRIVGALFATLTIPALYLLVRRAFDPLIALTSSLILAVMGWHIHFARIAFPTILWPLMVVLGATVLMEAIRRNTWRWWAFTGAILGLGIYSYNGHLPFLGLSVLYAIWHLLGWPSVIVSLSALLLLLDNGFATAMLFVLSLVLFTGSGRIPDRIRFANATATGASVAVIGLPMITYAANPGHDYFGYGKRLSIFNGEEWANLDNQFERAIFILNQYIGFWDMLWRVPVVDGVDATGATAIVPVWTLLLALTGVIVSVRRRPDPLVWYGMLILLALPLASAFSIDLAARRSLGIAPILAVFGGIGAIEVVRLMRERHRGLRYTATAVVTLVSLLSIHSNLDGYFGDTVTSQGMHMATASEMVQASLYVDSLPADTLVYFFSNRWSFNHEIRRFLAPDAHGEDRGVMFDPRYTENTDRPEQDDHFCRFALKLTRNESRTRVMLLLDDYRQYLAVIERSFPGGTTHVGHEVGRWSNGPGFYAYWLSDHAHTRMTTKPDVCAELAVDDAAVIQDDTILP